jgi:hypothetical protein
VADKCYSPQKSLNSGLIKQKSYQESFSLSFLSIQKIYYTLTQCIFIAMKRFKADSEKKKNFFVDRIGLLLYISKTVGGASEKKRHKVV